MRILIAALICLGLCLPAVAQEGEVMLRVVIEGAQAGEGQILLSLFDSEAAFLRNPAEEESLAIDEAGSAAYTFVGLAPGIYAVSAVYDRNSNNELDTNFLGIPREPVGVSNNPRARFGPPSFSDARFEIAAEDVEITIAVGAVGN